MKALAIRATVVLLCIAALVGAGSPLASASTKPMSVKKAAGYYVKIVKPLNREYDEWSRLTDGKHLLRTFTRQAGYVEHEDNVFVRKLIAKKWPTKAAAKVQKLILSELRAMDRWAAAAQSHSFTELRRAVRKLPSGNGPANAVRKALGLPRA